MDDVDKIIEEEYVSKQKIRDVIYDLEFEFGDDNEGASFAIEVLKDLLK